MSNFRHFLGQQRNAAAIAPNQQALEQQRVADLYDISGDPTGSPLDEHLSDEVSEVCREFIAEASNHGFPGTKPVQLKVIRPSSLVRIEPGQAPIDRAPTVWRSEQRLLAGNFVGNILLKQIWEGDAYAIGSISTDRDWFHADKAHQSEVVICTDGLLRCIRTPRTFPASRGTGYGRLPLPQPSGRNQVIIPREPFRNYMGKAVRNPNAGPIAGADDEYRMSPEDSLALKFAKILRNTR